MKKSGSLEEAQKHLESLISQNLDEMDVTLCIAAKAKSDELPVIQRIQITDSLGDLFRDCAKKAFGEMQKDIAAGDLVVRPYDVGSSLDAHEIEYLYIKDSDSIAPQVALLKSLTSLDECLGDNDSFIKNLRFYVIVLQKAGEIPIYCFRSYSHSRTITRSRGIAALLANGQFDRVEQPLFLFDDNVNCIFYDNHLYIRQKTYFQRIFGYFEEVIKTAKESLDLLNSRIPISNFDELEQACTGHLQMCLKINRIAQNDCIKVITMQDAKEHIERLGLEIKTSRKNGVEMIIFDKSKKWELFQLLEDGFLKSEMTGYTYDVNSKRRRQAK